AASPPPPPAGGGGGSRPPPGPRPAPRRPPSFCNSPTHPRQPQRPGEAPMSANRLKLSVMMFLEFFIWGAWLPLIFGYLPSLGFEDWQQSLILGAFNVAALVALFFSTQFADRHFAAEQFIALSHLVPLSPI